MIKIRTGDLADCIEKCFDLAMESRLTIEQSEAFLIEGKRLRGQWLNLVTAKFNDGTPEVEKANKEIAILNEKLDQVKNDLKTAADTVAVAAGLVNLLNSLLGMAVKFL